MAPFIDVILPSVKSKEFEVELKPVSKAEGGKIKVSHAATFT